MQFSVAGSLIVALTFSSLFSCGDPHANDNSLGLSAPHAGDAGATFAEFKSSLVADDQGYYRLEDDQRLDESGLQDYYDQHIAHPDALIVRKVNGTRSLWPLERRFNIRYCISDAFGSKKSKVVSAFAAATDEWGSAGGVRFVYVAAQDNNCTTANTGVELSVEYLPNLGARGDAFVGPLVAGGPNNSRRYYNHIRLGDGVFDTSFALSLKETVAHELGHTLGFYHEHASSSASKGCGTDTADATYEALTGYDPPSIMHYVWEQDSDCPVITRKGTLSPNDERGTAIAYPTYAQMTFANTANLCLAARGSSVVGEPCANTATTLWIALPSAQNATLRWMNAGGLCLHRKAGTPVLFDLATCNEQDAAQKFSLSSNSDKTQLISSSDGQCVSFSDARSVALSCSNETLLQITTFDYSDPERCDAAASYGRGVGSIPSSCDGGKTLSGGLCYNNCRSGYHMELGVCWSDCPSGYTDIGLFCTRGAKVVAAKTSRCPWYDKCGLTFKKGCSSCPAGYHNDGCTCRQEASVVTKNSYVPSVGKLPECGNNKSKDSGLCYDTCAYGYKGVGPLCWRDCNN